MALPSGRSRGSPLSNGLSPSSASERKGPTAALNSAAMPTLSETAHNGCIVNLKLTSWLLHGAKESRESLLAALIRGYFTNGGMQLQLNILDPGILVDALEHPEKYPNLLVRVSGYAAYFNDLTPEVKREIIARTAHENQNGLKK